MKVLVVVAHPDDEILGVGGASAHHAAAGDDVESLVVADGASSRYAAGAEATLQECGRKAAAVLGVRSIRYLGLPDQRLDGVPIFEIVRPIEAAIAGAAPDIVYTHHWGDLNRDHRVVCEAVTVACRPTGQGYPRRLLCFETPSSTEWSTTEPSMQFVPNFFVDVGATIERKLQAMSCYATEVRPPPHPRSLESLRARAQYWGQIVCLPYAEAFVLVREVL